MAQAKLSRRSTGSKFDAMALKAVLEMTEWRGQGEGGTLATIKIVGWDNEGYPWHSSPAAIRRAADIVEQINKLLENVDGT